jgi:F0F1-type ATP synthase assembly protein I
MEHSPDDRSAVARAAEWGSRVTAISLEMVVPGLIGLWIDRELGTVMVFLVLGMVLGVTAGMVHLIRMVTVAGQGQPSDRKPGERKPPDREPGDTEQGQSRSD